MWPTAATTPASTICAIAASAPSRSGAMVTMRIGPAAGVEHAVDLGGVRVAHQRRLVGAAPLGGQPRAFQMDPVDQARADVVGQFR